MSEFAGKSAVIVDDDYTSIAVLQKMLEQLGITVTVIQDSIEAGGQLRQVGPTDIIFLDLEMPRSNGYVVLEMIRQIPTLAELPVIAYTTHTSHLKSARQAGFDGFLGKPLDSRQFASQLARIFAGEAVWEVPS